MAEWWAAANVRAERVPTWVIGLLVAVLGWGPSFAIATTAGVDVSWWSGLYMAAHDQLQFGQEVIFTYGPLGFMKLPWLFYADLAVVAYVYCAAIFVAFCIGLVWALRMSAGPIVALVGAYLCVALVPGIEQALALVVFVALGIVAKRPGDRALYVYAVAGGLLASAEVLMKISIGPVILLALVIALIGCRARIGHLAAFGGSFVGGFLLFWLVTGQSISALPDFAINSIPIVSGYNEAMATEPRDPWEPRIMVLLALGTMAWTWFTPQAGRRERIAATLIAFFVVFSSYKQGVIRADTGHMAIFLATMAMVWAALPAAGRRVPLKLAGVVAFSAGAIWMVAPLGGYGINPIKNVDRFVDQSKLAFDSGEREEIVEGTRAWMGFGFGIDPEVAFGMVGKTVSVDPWEIAAAWSSDLEWDPLPIFQNYSAYTPKLDEINADALGSPDGPGRVLRQGFPDSDGTGIDNKLLVWDPPRQAVATLCNFRPEITGETWQLLERVPDRCGEQMAAGTVEAERGQQVEVPAPEPDEVVLARIHGAEISGLTKLFSTLYRPPLAYMTSEDGQVYRFVPALASGGLLLRSGREVPEGRGRFFRIPQMRTIAVNGVGNDLEFEFVRMTVK